MVNLPKRAQHSWLKIASTLIAWLWPVLGWTQNVVLDEATGIGAGADHTVHALALQADGKLLVAGSFTNFNGAEHRGLVRLMPSGMVDPEFNATGPFGGVGGPPAVYSVVIQSDRKILAGGAFTSFNGVNRTNLVRLLADGSLDPEFLAVPTEDRFGWSQPTEVRAIRVLPSGQILIGGQFRIGGRSVFAEGNLLARLNSDGSYDPAFRTGPFIGQTHKILAVDTRGDEAVFGGNISTNWLVFSGLGSTTGDGSPRWNPAADPADGQWVNALVTMIGGRLLAGGSYGANSSPTPVSVPWTARLGVVQSDNSIVQLAGFEADGEIYALSAELDGGFLAGGSFSYVSGVFRGGLARFMPDGRVDQCFRTVQLIAGSLSGQPSAVRSIVRVPDGQIWIAGDFTGVSGRTRHGLARLIDQSGCATNLVGFATDDFIAMEGDGTATVTINRVGSANGAVSVQFETVGGTASAGADYSPTRQTVVFLPGQNSQVVSIPLMPDAVAEGSETVELRLLNPEGLQLERANALLTIEDSPVTALEFQPDPTFRELNVASLSVLRDGRILAILPSNERIGTNLVRLNSDGSSDLSWTVPDLGEQWVDAVKPLSDGRTVLGGSFSSVNGVPIPGVAWLRPDGTLESSITAFKGWSFSKSQVWLGVRQLARLKDGALLVSGRFIATGQNAVRTNFVRLLPDGAVDLDAYSPPETETYPYLTECPDGRALIRVGNTWRRLDVFGRLDLGFFPRTPGFSLGYTMHVQSDGRILAAANALSSKGFPTDAPTLLRLLPDGRMDSTFQPVAGFSVAGPTPAWTPHFRIKEGPFGQILLAGFFDHILQQPRPSLAWLSPDGSLNSWLGWNSGDSWSGVRGIYGFATVGSDYLLVSMQPFETNQQTFAPVLRRYRLAPTGKSPSIRLVVPKSEVSESAGALDFQIVREGDASAPARVLLSTTTGTATAGADYTSIDEWIEFQPGERQRRISLKLVNDAEVEAPETFSLSLNAAIGASIISPASVSVTILDDDFGVEFSSAAYGVIESDALLTTKVWLVGTNIQTPLTVRVTATPKTATAGDDFVPLEQTIIFDRWFESPKTVVFKLVDDDQVEKDETFVIRATPLQAAGFSPKQNAVVTIHDNDQPGHPAMGADGVVLDMLEQPDGKILVSGGFERMNGSLRRAVARLNPDGTLDHGFSVGFDSGAWVRRLALQSDGRILALGSFTNVQGSSRQSLVRLLPDGALDQTFAAITVEGEPWGYASALPLIQTMTIQLDGMILVGGSFSKINGVNLAALARLRADGSVDPEFSIAITRRGQNPAVISALARDGSGRIVVVGAFESVGGTGHNGMARLLANGSPDTAFRPELKGVTIHPISFPPQPYEADNWVELLAVQGSRILVYRRQGSGRDVYGNVESTLVRLRSTGALDSGFQTITDAYWVPKDVYAIRLLPDGGALLGGSGGLVRLRPEGWVDRNFVFPILDWSAYVGELNMGVWNNFNGPLGYTYGSDVGPSVFATLVTSAGETWFGGNFSRVGIEPLARMGHWPAASFGLRAPRLYPPQQLRDGRLLLIADSDGYNRAYFQQSTNLTEWSSAPYWDVGSQTRMSIVRPESSPQFYRIQP